jgi:hypothetical protein
VRIRPVFSMFFAVLQKLRLVKRTLEKQILILILINEYTTLIM